MLELDAQYRLLKKCLPGLLEKKTYSAKFAKICLPEQPFDHQLLTASSLFNKSRERFLTEGGVFHASLLSSPRSLSSAGLLENRIEYSPIESELFWSILDPLQSRTRAGREHFFKLRSFTTSTFHEQNHRILWKALPPAPKSAEGLRRYLNFAESLVITLDMALGDELGPKVAAPFYFSGAIYDPGTSVLEELRTGSSAKLSKGAKRLYRNYLQAALFVTYLYLELYEPEKIRKAARILFQALSGKLIERACDRSLNLDLEFVTRTNPSWQKRNLKQVLEALPHAGHEKHSAKRRSRSRPEPVALELLDDPLQNHQQYLIAESWFESFGL